MTEEAGTPKFLKTGEVADLLHVTTKTVNRYVRAGRLPYTKTLGGHTRFPAEAIRALIDENTHQ